MDPAQNETFNARQAPAFALKQTQTRLPAEVGVWMIVLVDMTVFAILFVVFLNARTQEPELFTQSERTLDRTIGVINTLLLLTSSWCVVNGVTDARATPRSSNALWFTAATVCGLGFVANKALEYSMKLSEGITPNTNNFYMYYYVLTGLHLLHVLIGIGVLVYLRAKARARAATPGAVMLFEGGGAYWHMVDLLWIFLFPLLYLMG